MKVTPIKDAVVHKIYDTVALVNSTAPPLVMSSGVPRSPGLHLSQILGGLYEYINKRPQDDDVFRGSVYMATGFAWEQILGWAIERVFPSDRILNHLGEVEKDGILMSPDGFDTVDCCLEEWKCTWKSALKRPPDDFPSWMWQMKAYCHALEVNKARLRILHISGSYYKPAVAFCGRCATGPCIHTWELEFTQQELVANWAMVVNYAKETGLL